MSPELAASSAPSGSDPDRRARAWLSRAAEPGSAVLFALVREVGATTAVDLLRRGQAPPSAQDAVGSRRDLDQSAADLETAARHGVRLLVPGDQDWPAGPLLAMELAVERGRHDLAPPLALWLRGPLSPAAACTRAVAVIGSRAATPYGEHVAADLGFGLAERGWTVVSGGALGVDGAAHRGALSADGATAAVLAGGLDRPYPTAHAALFERIAASGLLLSEWPPGCAPYRTRFLVRNRLIAGLSAGTVVVEAAARSGAASTARRARELGRPLMAVPGPVTSAASVGTHELLRAEPDAAARLVCSAAHVLEEVGAAGEFAPAPRRPSRPRDGLDPSAARVLEAVPARRPAVPERIAVAAGVAVSEVLRVLPALEIRGLAELTTEGWRLSTRSR